MGKEVIDDPYIVINGTNFSDHCSSVTVNWKRALVDTTNFAPGGGSEAVLGLNSDNVELTIQNDLANGSVDQVLTPLHKNGTEFTVEIRYHAAAVGVNNPKWTGTFILPEYTPIDGKKGQLADTKLKLPSQRTGITRATS
ncbi:hypothetical protein [Streptomyces sp. NPDC055085]